MAERESAELLVVGSSRRGLAGRVLLGDDTHAALNGASCAVAVAPTGYARVSAVIREIGVGYDGSPESEQALALGRKLASELRARLSAFQAISVPAYVLGAGPSSIEASIEDAVSEARERIAELARHRAARRLRIARGGTHHLQRVGRSADHRLTRIRTDRTDRARQRVGTAGPERPRPAARPAARRPPLIRPAVRALIRPARPPIWPAVRPLIRPAVRALIRPQL